MLQSITTYTTSVVTCWICAFQGVARQAEPRPQGAIGNYVGGDSVSGAVSWRKQHDRRGSRALSEAFSSQWSRLPSEW